MADLDDFFAKKDKKKKGTKKFSKANADVIAKNLEESARKEQKAQEKQETLATSAALNEEKGTEIMNKKEEEEEWDDYRENKKDYTGLKIETLKIEENVDEDGTVEQVNEDGEVVKVKKGEAGVWKKKAGNATHTVEQVEEKPPAEPEPPGSNQPNVVGGSYVPPHLRGAAAASSSSPQEVRRPLPRRSRQAPDINSEVYFPSLSSTVDDSAPKGAWGKKLTKQDEGQFEEVRESGKGQMYSRNSEAPRLTLGNKFDALRDGD